MNTDVKIFYRQARARGNVARAALDIARRHVAGPVAKYMEALEAWEAEPDKRRYAPGGSANRPKYPRLYDFALNTLPFELRECEPPRHFEGGYYTDEFYHNVMQPKVWRLPGEHGFLAGYVNSEECGYRLVKHVQLSERGAWYVADSEAKADAEESCEYQRRWSEASAADDARSEARETIKQARQTFRRLRESMRPDFPDAVCQLVKREMRACVRDVREAARTIRRAGETIADAGMTGEFPA